MHLIPWIIIIGSWRISCNLNYAYRLHLLNYPSSCTPSSWPTQMFQKILFTSCIACNIILWNFFLLKKIISKCNSLVWKVCQSNVSSIYNCTNVRYTYKIFKTSNEVLTWNNTDVCTKQFVFVKQTISTYIQIVNAPTLNQSAICVALNPWANQ
jgi:hypothetical protein